MILIVIEVYGYRNKESKEFKKIGFNTRIGNKIGTLQLIWNILEFYIFFFNNKKRSNINIFFYQIWITLWKINGIKWQYMHKK